MELFAGIRGARAALASLPVQVVHDLVSEINEWQNVWASYRWPGEQLVPDVADITEELIIDMLLDGPKYDVVLLVAGFPCKDTSRLKHSRQNLQGSQSSLFFHIPRIRDCFRKHAEAPVYIVVENTWCDKAVIQEINAHLDVLPLRVNASRVSAASRDRLWWTDAVFLPTQEEKMVINPLFVNIELEHDPRRLDILDAGATFHKDFTGTLPCVTGFRPALRPPHMPAGIAKASETAKERWRQAGFATQVYHFEDQHLVWPSAAQMPGRKCVEDIRAWHSGLIYIGRGSAQQGLAPSKWGNPFKVSKYGREQSISKFARHLAYSQDLQGCLPELSGMTLVCHCRPHESCHGDVLIDMWTRTLGAAEQPRLPSVTELVRIQGFEDGYLDGPEDAHAPVEAVLIRKRDALGNTFNVNVLRRIIANILYVAGLLPPPATAPAVPALARPLWAHPKHFCSLEHIRVQAESIARDFGDLMSLFDNFLRYHDIEQQIMGPDFGEGARHVNKAAVGSQPAPFISKHGSPALLSHDISLEEHVRQAQSLKHPFNVVPKLALDLDFAWSTIVGMGSGIVQHRQQTLQRLQCLQKACQTLDEMAVACMDMQVHDVARGVRPALMAALVHIIRWPDWSLPDCFVSGFRVTGIIPASNLFRKVPRKQGLQESDLLGEGADAWNEALARDTKVHPTDHVIFEGTETERSKGYLEGYFTKADLDKRFGRGGWRAIRRRCIYQESHGKYRLIDNCRTSLHNSAATASETISTVPSDIAVQNFMFLRSLLNRPLDKEWSPLLGTDDFEDAYRCIPNHSKQDKFSVFAFRHPAWKGGAPRMIFAVSKAHLFGLSAAVLNFNRVPEFLIAVCRRLAAVPCWHFFDDSGTAGVRLEAGSGQHFLNKCFEICGFKQKVSKHQPMAPSCLHLGIVNNFSRASEDICVLDPKEGRVARTVTKIDKAFDDNFLDPTEAASIRGDTVFLSATSFRKVIRGGLGALGRRQAESRGSSLTDDLRSCLNFLRHALTTWEPVHVSLTPSADKPAILYVDASFDLDLSADQSLPLHARCHGGLGALLILPDGSFHAYACEVPAEFWAALEPRDTQIIPAELVTPACVAFTAQKLLQGRPLIIFGDNLPAVCSSISGSTGKCDLQQIVSATHYAFWNLHCPWWMEWVPSELNPADPLSRGKPSPYTPFVNRLLIPTWAYPSPSRDFDWSMKW